MAYSKQQSLPTSSLCAEYDDHGMGTQASSVVQNQCIRIEQHIERLNLKSDDDCAENMPDSGHLISLRSDYDSEYPHSKMEEDLDVEDGAVMSIEQCSRNGVLGEYDVFILHDNDDEQAVKFIAILQKFVKRADARTPVTVCTESTFWAAAGGNRLTGIELALSKSLRHFVFISENSTVGSNWWFRFGQDQTLVTVLKNPEIALYVIKTLPSISCPFSLYTRTEFIVSQLLLNNRSLKDVTVDSLCLADLNPQRLGTLTRMCISPIGAAPYNHSADVPKTVRGAQIMQKMDWLVQHIDPENGLIGQLFSKQVIGFDLMTKAKASLKRKSFFETNELLLAQIMFMPDDKLKEFEEALKETNQEHIVKYIARG